MASSRGASSTAASGGRGIIDAAGVDSSAPASLASTWTFSDSKDAISSGGAAASRLSRSSPDTLNVVASASTAVVSLVHALSISVTATSSAISSFKPFSMVSLSSTTSASSSCPAASSGSPRKPSVAMLSAGLDSKEAPNAKRAFSLTASSNTSSGSSSSSSSSDSELKAAGSVSANVPAFTASCTSAFIASISWSACGPCAVLAFNCPSSDSGSIEACSSTFFSTAIGGPSGASAAFTPTCSPVVKVESASLAHSTTPKATTAFSFAFSSSLSVLPQYSPKSS
mmetsp:Transcript_145246/g.362290  ORF Transcript_145246/g.362290 Transcript_145246/m.362290 type:complete len:284 (-) Transcript_145246:65-916(-)